MEIWILVFILIGIGVGVSHISNQLASLTHAVNQQTAYIKQHHEEPNIFVPNANEIAAAIVVELNHHSELPEQIARKLELSEISERIARETHYQLEDNFVKVSDAIREQMGYPQFGSPDPNRPSDVREHLSTIEWKLENIKGV